MYQVTTFTNVGYLNLYLMLMLSHFPRFESGNAFGPCWRWSLWKRKWNSPVCCFLACNKYKLRVPVGQVSLSLIQQNIYFHVIISYIGDNVVRKTDWHRIVIFKPYLRESALKYVTKGKRVLVQGRIIYGNLKDSEGQVTSTSCSILADDILFLNKVS